MLGTAPSAAAVMVAMGMKIEYRCLYVAMSNAPVARPGRSHKRLYRGLPN